MNAERWEILPYPIYFYQILCYNEMGLRAKNDKSEGKYNEKIMGVIIRGSSRVVQFYCLYVCCA